MDRRSCGHNEWTEGRFDRNEWTKGHFDIHKWTEGRFDMNEWTEDRFDMNEWARGRSVTNESLNGPKSSLPFKWAKGQHVGNYSRLIKIVYKCIYVK